MDGVVRAGSSNVNQAPITGESKLIEKVAGAEVFASSINGEHIIYANEFGFMPAACIRTGSADEAAGRGNQQKRLLAHAKLIDDFIQLRGCLAQKAIDRKTVFGLRVQYTKFPKSCMAFNFFMFLSETNGLSNFGRQLFMINAIQCKF